MPRNAVVVLFLLLLAGLGYGQASPCTDSDNGRELFQRGTITSTSSFSTTTREDYCASADVVTEFECFGNSVGSGSWACPSGKCENGACIPPASTPTSCSNSHGSADYGKQGTVIQTNSLGQFSKTDYCKNDREVVEFWCTGKDVSVNVWPCFKACLDGACISAVASPSPPVASPSPTPSATPSPTPAPTNSPTPPPSAPTVSGEVTCVFEGVPGSETTELKIAEKESALVGGKKLVVDFLWYDLPRSYARISLYDASGSLLDSFDLNTEFSNRLVNPIYYAGNGLLVKLVKVTYGSGSIGYAVLSVTQVYEERTCFLGEAKCSGKAGCSLKVSGAREDKIEIKSSCEDSTSSRTIESILYRPVLVFDCSKPSTCADGTRLGECSVKARPNYCGRGGMVAKASVCGCSPGLVVVEDNCMYPILECSDSDGGKAADVAGRVRLVQQKPDGSTATEILSDKCHDGDQLDEYFCTPLREVGALTTRCSNGCSEGACVPVLEKVSLAVNVKAGADGKAVQGAVVELRKSGVSRLIGIVASDASGRALFENIELGTIAYLVVRADGFSAYNSIVDGPYIELSQSGKSVDVFLSPPQPSSCTDSDGGFDHYNKGTATGESFAVGNTGQPPFTDKCVTAGGISIINEYECSDGKVHMSPIKCPEGCADGACLLPSTFPAIYYSPDYGAKWSLKASLAVFDSQESRLGIITPLRKGLDFVAVDAFAFNPSFSFNPPSYYALGQHVFYAINPANGEALEIIPPADLPSVLSSGSSKPQLSSPAGIAFDSKRRRVVIATLGGTGHLYAYTPATSKWSAIQDLKDVDLNGIAYAADEDALYGIEPGWADERVSNLHKFDSRGNIVSTKKLSFRLPRLGESSSRTQLAYLRDRLVLLKQEFKRLESSGEISGMRLSCYAINKDTGEVKEFDCKPPKNENQNQVCVDSDGGRVFSQKGVLTTVTGAQFTDSCDSFGRLEEYSCAPTGNTVAETVSCPAGQECRDGACVYSLVSNCRFRYSARCVETCADGTRSGECSVKARPNYCDVGGQIVAKASICGCSTDLVAVGDNCMYPILECSDSDGGKATEVAGRVRFVQQKPDGITATEILSDKCHDGDQLDEYFCTPLREVGALTTRCSNGCRNGACVSPPPPNGIPPVRFIDSTLSSAAPALSGNYLAYEKLGDDYVSRLYLYNLDSNQKQLVDDSCFGFSHSSIAIDEERVAYACAGKGLVLYDLASGKKTILEAPAEGKSIFGLDLDGLLAYEVFAKDEATGSYYFQVVVYDPETGKKTELERGTRSVLGAGRSLVSKNHVFYTKEKRGSVFWRDVAAASENELVVPSEVYGGYGGIVQDVAKDRFGKLLLVLGGLRGGEVFLYDFLGKTYEKVVASQCNYAGFRLDGSLLAYTCEEGVYAVDLSTKTSVELQPKQPSGGNWGVSVSKGRVAYLQLPPKDGRHYDIVVRDVLASDGVSISSEEEVKCVFENAAKSVEKIRLKEGQSIKLGSKEIKLVQISRNDPVESGAPYHAFFELWENGARLDYFSMNKEKLAYEKNGVYLKVSEVFVGGGDSSYAVVSAGAIYSCYSAAPGNAPPFSCTTSLGEETCVAAVKANNGEKITWKSSCGGYAYTTVDGVNEHAKFNCGSGPASVSVSTDKQVYAPGEQVKVEARGLTGVNVASHDAWRLERQDAKGGWGMVAASVDCGFGIDACDNVCNPTPVCGIPAPACLPSTSYLAQITFFREYSFSAESCSDGTRKSCFNSNQFPPGKYRAVFPYGCEQRRPLKHAFEAAAEFEVQKGDCACPAIYTPVCGVDGNTYSSACDAKCAGVEVGYDGDCVEKPVEQSFPLVIHRGWNLVGMPFGKLVEESGSSGGECKILRARHYDSVSKRYRAVPPAKVFSEEFLGKSLWVYSASQCVKQLKGYYLDSQSLQLLAGYNLFSVQSTAFSDAESILTDCEMSSGPRRYDSLARKFVKEELNSEKSSLKPGVGYAVRVKKDCTLKAASIGEPPLPEEAVATPVVIASPAVAGNAPIKKIFVEDLAAGLVRAFGGG